jgi:putative membrane-bound dehydrogenase-like protein
VNPVQIIAVSLATLGTTLSAADGIKSISKYSEAYGATKAPVTVDPAKELPRYPAVEPKNAVATWKVKPGYKLELAAHEPQVTDPIAICFDERGRLYACEMIDYSEMRDADPHLGRISRLEDTDGDGYYDKSTVFADNLAWPTGLIWAYNQLFVIATPDIWSFKDSDADGKAETREKVFTGFGTGLKLINVQGMANSPQWGQDNRVHVLAGGGNRGIVTSPKRPDLPGVELGGKDFWFDPLTLDFGLEAGGAQYGMSFDDYGRKFGCSNSDHLQHWVYEDRFTTRNPHYRMPSSRQSIAADGGAAEVFRLSPDEPWRILRTRWRISGVVKGSVEGGGRVSGYFTGATGTTIYRGDALGPDFVNNSFTGDAGGQLVHRKIIRPAADGVNLTGERPADERGYEFAASTDTWVRVVNFANAPDGCLYICDMYREVIEHPWSIPEEIKKHIDLNNGNTRGRLYRLVPDRADWKRRTAVNLADAPSTDLVQTLTHANGWHRDTAHRLLIERQDQNAIAPLKALLKAETPAPVQLHALGILKGLKALDPETLNLALASTHPAVIERALQLEDAMALPATSPAPNPRVTFATLLALGDQSPSEPIITTLANALKTTNAWHLAAVHSAPPAFAAPVLAQALASEVPQQNLAPLLVTIGAENQASDVTATLALITRQTLAEQTALVTALAEGLRKAGTSIEKADTAGHLDDVFTSATQTAIAEDAPDAERRAAIQLLGLSAAPKAHTALKACLAEGQPETVQTTAVATLAKQNAKDFAPHLLTHWSGLAPKARAASLTALLDRADRTTVLLNQINQPDAPTAKDLSAAQVQNLIQNKDASLAKLARQKLAAVIPPSREEVAKQFAPALALKGDRAAGRNHYIGRCMACHIAEGMGIAVGPDMVTVKTRGRDGILAAILDPHKEVAPQFIAYTFTKKDGSVVPGIITQDDASGVTLKMMGGAEVTLPRGEIQGSTSTGQSLMPEGLETGLTPQDMADLLAFIEGL